MAGFPGTSATAQRPAINGQNQNRLFCAGNRCIPVHPSATVLNTYGRKLTTTKKGKHEPRQ